MLQRLADLDRGMADQRESIAVSDARYRSQQEQIAEVVQQQAAQEQQIRAGRDLVRDELTRTDRTLTAMVRGLRERLARTERRVRYWTNGPAGPALRAALEDQVTPTAELQAINGLDYAGFEERFRGSEDEIKERQRVYVELFRDRGDVLDLGCGRASSWNFSARRSYRARRRCRSRHDLALS
jgi:O-antigen chain-terminating methyltransferase